MKDDLAFFEVAAQIIPLIFIVLLLEVRMFERYIGVQVESTDPLTKSTLTSIVTVLSIISLLFVGEFRALTVLAREEASRFDFVTVKLAMLTGTWFSFFPLARTLNLASIKQLPSRQGQAARVLILLVFVGGAAAATLAALFLD